MSTVALGGLALGKRLGRGSEVVSPTDARKPSINYIIVIVLTT